MPMTLMKRMASGAYSTICRTELMATRMAQYSLSPPARPVQMRTMAMHRASPTKMSPSRKPDLSGKNAQDKASMRKGAMIQLTKTLKAIWIQISRFLNAWWSVSNLTLQRMGYIMTSNPTAIGTETPTNFPFCSAGPVLGTKLPRMMPMAIARKIQSARKRSSKPRDLKAETLVVEWSPACFSGSGTGS